MSTYRFKGPDGQVIELNGPDNATPEQQAEALHAYLGTSAPAPKADNRSAYMDEVRGALMRGIDKPAAKPSDVPGFAEPDDSFIRKFGRGFVNNDVESALAAKQLAQGKLDEGDLNAVKMLQSDRAAGGGWYEGGDIASKLKNSIPAAGWGVLKNALLAAANSGILTPTESNPDSKGALYGARLKQAALGGGGALLGGALMKSASNGLVTPSADAREVMDAGVTPTVAQGADNMLVRGAFGAVPTLGLTKARQEKELLQSLTDQYAQGVSRATGQEAARLAPKTVAEANATLAQLGDGAYNRIYNGKQIALTPAVRGDAYNAASAIMNPVDQSGAAASQQALRVVREAIGDDTASTLVNNSQLEKRYLGGINDAINRAAQSTEKMPQLVVEGLKNARQVLKDARAAKLSQQERAAAKELSDVYPIRKLLTESTSPAATGVKVGDLLNTLEKRPGGTNNPIYTDIAAPLSRMTAESSNRLVKLGHGGALPSLAAAGMYMSNPAAVGLAATLGGLGVVGQTKAGANALFGNTASQKAMADALRRLGLDPGYAGSQLAMMATEGD